MKTEVRSTFLALLLALLAPVSLRAQTNWIAHSGQLWAATSGNGLHLVVGEYGLIYTSPNLVTWTQRPSGTPARLLGAAFANGQFVVLGDAGTMLTSSNAIAWTPRNPGTLSNLVAVASGNGGFVAVGESGIILHSPDGITWSPRVSGSASYLSHVAFANGTWLAVGGAGTILTSSDGVLWQPQASGTDKRLTRVAFGNALFVAVGEQGTVLTSPDAVTWTIRDSGYSGFLASVAFGAGQFVVTGAVPGTILVSSDGLGWTPANPRTVPPTGSDVLPGLDFGMNSFLAVGAYCTVWSSMNGMDWTLCNFSTGARLSHVAFGADEFVAVGNVGEIVTSSDGVNWARQNSGSNAGLGGVCFGNGLFVVVGAKGTILTSPDGVNWSPRDGQVATGLNRVAFANGQFVATGSAGTILTSPDGITWTPRDSGTSQTLLGIAFGNGRFVIVGVGGTVLTSPDGIAWTALTSGTAVPLLQVVYGGNTFVIVGISGTVLTSLDGLSWTPPISVTEMALEGVTYRDGQFVAVGGTTASPSLGVILTSSNGIDWSVQASNSNYPELSDVAYGKHKFVAVGQFGMVTSSTDDVLSLTIAPTAGLPKFNVVNGVTAPATNDFLKWFGRIMTLGDFNKDGFMDVAISADKGVILYLGSSNGTLIFKHNYPVGGRTFNVVAADFNEDGNLDLALDGLVANSFGIMLGNGDGTFQNYSKLRDTAGTSVPVVRVADFNGDGHNDIALMDQIDAPGNGRVYVLLGNGDGTFQLKSTLTVPPYANTMVTGDFDNDGIQDVAVDYGNASTSHLSVFSGQGDGAFTAPHTTVNANVINFMTTGDFNGDGNMDIATANLRPGGGLPGPIGILLGNGDGSFRNQPNLTAGPQPWNITTGDLNGDGILDLIVGDATDFNDLNVLLGKGDGTFAARTKLRLAAGYRNLWVTAADINNDGRIDLAVLAQHDTLPNRIYFALNQGLAPTNSVSSAFQLTIQSAPERTNIVEATSDFQTWSPIYTNSTPAGALRFVDSPPAGTPQRFYRAR